MDPAAQAKGRLFGRYIGIDYSGAGTAHDSLSGLRVYLASAGSPPEEVLPPPGRRRHWSRAGIAAWLLQSLRCGPPAAVGIDHGFSFPLAWFERHGLPADWETFLEDFHGHWPTDRAGVRVEDVRRGRVGEGAARAGDSRWRRLAERRSGAAKSVFHFDVQGSVAKSTHAGLPWLLHLRRELGARIHVWPFDGWCPPGGRHVLAEVYPRLCSDRYPAEGRTADQHDAYSVAAWLQEADAAGALCGWFEPLLGPAERDTAAIEGWVLGVS
jgi:hypothetical protein